MKKDIPKSYGPQSASDNSFCRKARLLQSYWRCEMKYELRKGPYNNSTAELGSMLKDGALNGNNFLLKETFEYAKQRVKYIQPEETIESFRLFHNMLSSQPMAFNLFHPLILIKAEYPNQLNKMMRDALPDFKISSVEKMLIEFCPYPIETYTNDISAMDAFIAYRSGKKRMFISIETKYVEALGANRARDNESKIKVAKESKLFTDLGIDFISKGAPQLYRNFLLAEKYRMVNGFHDSFSVIIAPKGNTSTDDEIIQLKKFLLLEFQYKIQFIPLETFVSAIQKNVPTSFKEWIDAFHNRYLNFEPILPYLNSK